MLEGIIWAVSAGIMLGLYALPEKFTRNFSYENTWSLFFVITMFIVPYIAAVLLLNGLQIFGMISSSVLVKMGIASLLWGIGVVLWGKAISHIGLSLGFSIFIGTLIFIGSLIPWFIDASGNFQINLPDNNILFTILAGLSIVLIGVVFNGRAGLIREADESDIKKEIPSSTKNSMLSGILIAVVGGVLATAFSYSNAIGKEPFILAAQELGLAEWKASIGVMNVIYVSGGIAAIIYYAVALTSNKAWGLFKTKSLGKNVGFIIIMSILNFTASVTFSYAASELGPDAGKTVGYAIFNAMSVLTATLSGLIVGEWKQASSSARKNLYIGLISMVLGIIIVSIGNGLGA